MHVLDFRNDSLEWLVQQSTHIKSFYRLAAYRTKLRGYKEEGPIDMTRQICVETFHTVNTQDVIVGLSELYPSLRNEKCRNERCKLYSVIRRSFVWNKCQCRNKMGEDLIIAWMVWLVFDTTATHPISQNLLFSFPH